MLNFFHVARNTLRESLREPIFFILLVSAVSMIGIFPVLSMFVFREQIKLVTDSAMATTLVFGLVAAVLSASHTVAREMRNGTVLLLLSKPVHRWNFVLAKVFGVLGALTIFVFICNLASLISLYIAKDQFELQFTTMYIYYGAVVLSCAYGIVRNYLAQKSFSACTIMALLVIFPIFVLVLSFLPAKEQAVAAHLYVIPALILLQFAVWAMGGITVALATRLDMVPNMICCAIIFALGLVSNYFLGKGTDTSWIFKFFYALVPNWQFFWMADALAKRQEIPIVYLAWAALYIVIYMSICCLLAIAMFYDREVASDIK